MKRVLILDANQRSALAATRSLGRRGIPIITADETSDSLAGSSRYSELYFRYPSPRTDSKLFVDTLVHLISEYNIEILLPMTELTTTLVLEAKFHNVIIPFADVKTVESLADKCSLMLMAEELEIPVPKTWHAETPEQLPVNLIDLPYPLVLKPGKSWLRRDNEWSRNAVRFANNPASAEEILRSDPAFHSHPFMLQQCVSGHGQGLFALYDHGKPVAFFAHRRLREKPPAGGVSVLSESIAIDQDILTYARKLLDRAVWHGVAMVEFKVDDNDGTPYLMEVNTRFWGSLQLAVNAGVDFPWLLYQLACGQTLTPLDGYKTGVRSRWLLGDLDNLYLVLRDRHYSVKNKLIAIRQFMTPSPFKTRHEVNRWGDMRPFWHELKRYVRDLFR